MKTTENSERLGWQVGPGFEPGTSLLPALKFEIYHSASGGALIIKKKINLKIQLINENIFYVAF